MIRRPPRSTLFPLHDALPISRPLLTFRLERVRGPAKPGPRRFSATLSAAFAVSSREIRSKRSEEHTSELQSPCNLVCRLLLEKKKKQTAPSPHPSHLVTLATL